MREHYRIRAGLHSHLQTGVHCILLVSFLHLYTGSDVEDGGHEGDYTPPPLASLCFFLHSARLFTLHTLTPH